MIVLQIKLLPVNTILLGVLYMVLTQSIIFPLKGSLHEAEYYVEVEMGSGHEKQALTPST